MIVGLKMNEEKIVLYDNEWKNGFVPRLLEHTNSQSYSTYW